ncbi:MAG: deoxyribodipyrimidine photo-lyase [Planctomycetota bacterium]
MRPLVWFRADLRVRDNTALHHACLRADRGVVAAFTICPDQWLHEHDWADCKVEFLLRNLGSLRSSLEALRIPLKLIQTPRFESVPERLLALARETGCDALWFNREYELNEKCRDDATRVAFERAGLSVHPYHDQVVLPPGSVRTNEDRPYTVYTPFRKKWAAVFAELNSDGQPLVLPAPAVQEDIAIESDPIPGSMDGFDLSLGRPDLWEAGEPHGLDRLRQFSASRIGSYKDRRDTPSVNGTSTLSPYLALGVVSPRQCLTAAMGTNRGRVDSGDAGAVGWIQELIWREFYKHLVEAFPRLCMGTNFRREYDAIEWNEDESQFEAWCEGRTGYPIVDAAMRQLNQTGWMHNRLRMITAMFLTKDLLIDWRKGERYFMRRLIDGDYASNNGGWQWSASTGTDAQPYFRIFNPTTQGERYDPDGDFIRRFVPELSELTGKAIHNPSEAGLFSGLDYPPPIVNHAQARDRTLTEFKRVRGA